jgi:hypothetical protein
MQSDFGSAATASGSQLGHPLWLRLSGHHIGPADASLSFAARLARENGWTAAHTQRVLEEYRRFVFLAMTAGHEVTPSDAVDQAWHLHLTYTRDYWDMFCPWVLGGLLHHGPTAGGAAETHRFHANYAATLAAYETAFGTPPPEDLWPPAAKRLRDDPRARRVHPRDGVVVPRWLMTLVLLAAVVAAAALAIGRVP